jgi:undecaprenyl diphosphate synthase
MQALFDVLPPASEDWRLAQSLDPARLPAHIAVIMDGNGRWAGRRSLPRAAGHHAGVEPVRATVETCARLGIESLTLYAFSVENWKRPQAEVETLWRLLSHYLRREMPTLCKNGVRFRAIGRLEGLSPAIQRELRQVTEETAVNAGLTLNLAINYGGRTEIVDAVNRLIADARLRGELDSLMVDEESLASRLYTVGQPEPDLLIRTSGEMRISNFLLWQIAYAELYVTETLWPDFSRTELLRAIAEYQRRDRRFGGVRAHADQPQAKTTSPSEDWIEQANVPAR